ncbi:hypothetical protein LJC07_07250 [Christensenellaceae bacterium OttesenSCG-928-L17]|nr:hypothetical protein [Christensenellaceae bacterium OttesenSCG-928-L17]
MPANVLQMDIFPPLCPIIFLFRFLYYILCSLNNAMFLHKFAAIPQNLTPYFANNLLGVTCIIVAFRISAFAFFFCFFALDHHAHKAVAVAYIALTRYTEGRMQKEENEEKEGYQYA